MSKHGWTHCQNCNAIAEEICPDGYCRACHVDLSFEECNDGTWSAQILLDSGSDPGRVRGLYPDARIEWEKAP